jgi:hypothetical protein
MNNPCAPHQTQEEVKRVAALVTSLDACSILQLLNPYFLFIFSPRTSPNV